MNFKTLFVAATVATTSLVLGGCEASLRTNSGLFGSTYTPNAYNNGYGGYNAGGPVGRVAATISTRQVPSMSLANTNAGQSIHRGAGFDPATFGSTWAQDDAERPFLVPAVSVGPSTVTVPNGGGESGNAQTGGNSGQAASDTRVDRIARVVGNLAIDAERTNETLAQQGRTLQRIDRRLRHGSRHRAAEPEQADPPPAAPAHPTELVMDSD